MYSFKPDGNLLNVKFEGYKLSESAIDARQVNLPHPVAFVKLKENEFSYQHTRAHALHNHLHFDPSDPF